MKKSKILCIVFMLIALTSLMFGCSEEQVDYSDRVKVVFALEGGTYKNSIQDVTYYFDFSNVSSRKIVYPGDSTLGNTDALSVTNSDLVLDGWYRTKIVNGDTVTYEDKWDFDNDVLDGDELTLYAKWKPAVTYIFKLYYKDNLGELVYVDEKEVLDNVTFPVKTIEKLANKRSGYTSIAYFDEEGNPWDETFKFQESTVNQEKKVIVEYVQGEYTVVNTAKEFKSAVTGAKPIYLTADIDFENATLDNMSKCKGINGNNHTISNFELKYTPNKNNLIEDMVDDTKKAYKVSMFGDLKNTEIKDVTFVGVTFTVDAGYTGLDNLYFAPLSVNMTGVTVSNVSVTGDLNITTHKNLTVLKELINPYYQKDDTTTITGFTGVLLEK